ncbi:FAD-dependent monooxygenase [Streptomyces specialis]|uniref:FAD-dependent monooxygenase n=1 Tax=Streptomyces specialis TaxID=498367 RepID=UPI00073E5F57|nr:FAD-dependent monooxygenase [Streptomyces specialis]
MEAAAPGARTDGRVLVVGAGPSGLVAALELARHRVRARVVDRRAGPVPAEQSRATIVHARTLEVLDRFGLAERLLARGVPITRVEVRERGRPTAHLPLADAGVEGRTRFPCALSVAQSETERILVAALAERGVPVEWGRPVTDVVPDGHGVTVRLGGGDGGDGRRAGTVRARWVVAADGAASTVRRRLGIGFTGGTYPQRGLLADVTFAADAPPPRLRLTLTRGGFVGVLPIGPDRYRLFGAVPPGLAPGGTAGVVSHDPYQRLDARELRRWYDGWFGAAGTLDEVVWASLFRFHSRIADRFARDGVFLVGDAAHVHNPAGGQGLNLGVGDAANLGWKLALVARGEAPPGLLGSYEAERRPVARAITRNTDRGFRLETTAHPVAVWLRSHVAVRLIAVASRWPPVRRTVFRTLSQTWIGYRGSPAVARGRGRGVLRPGDRAPHAPLAATGGGLLDVLRPGGPHLLAFEGLRPSAAARQDAAALGAALAGRYAAAVPVHVVPRSERAAHEAYGARRARLVLLRPDGHVAWAGPWTPRTLATESGAYWYFV